MENKIKVYVEEHIWDILEKDSKDFDLPKNQLMNRLVKYFYNKLTIKTTMDKTSSNKAIMFNLNKHNSEFLNLELLIKKDYKIKADYFRDIIYSYIVLSPKQRAEIIFSELINKMKKIIKNQLICKVKFHGEIREIEPYDLNINPDDKFYYLVCYDYKYKKLLSYRLYNIKEIFETEEKFKNYLQYKNRIKGISKHFDAFLSYDSILKVRLTENGVKKLESAYINRPELIKKEEDIFYFYCNEFKALIYFPPFFEDAEIIEPLEVRKKLNEKLKIVLKLYEHYE